MSIVTIISLIIATIIPLAALYIIKTRDLYSTGAFRIVLLSFAWGIVAFLIAAQINSNLIWNVGIDRLFVLRFVAPFGEEILKGLILLYLVRRRQFTYFVDGAIYGFAIGIGFAIIENYEYLLYADQSQQLMIAIIRVISTNLMHATCSSVIGIILGYSRFSKRSGVILYLAGGLLISISLHTLFNVISNAGISNLLIFIAIVVVIGVAGFSFIIFLIRRGLKEAREWIKEKLGMADKVTAGEAAVVHNLQDISTLLGPLVATFGEEKGNQIEKLLLKQARLGILRKTLDKLQDEKLVASTQEEMQAVRAEMEEMRSSIGSYAMIYLRGIFPEEDNLIWGRLENMIAERISASPTPQRGGLWDKLDTQINAARKDPDSPIEP